MLKNVYKILIILVLAGQFLFQGISAPVLNTPLYLAMMIILGALTVLAVIGSAKLKISAADIAIWMLFLNIVIVSLITDKFDMGRILLILFSILFMYAIKSLAKDRENVRFLYIAYISIVLISSVVAIAQFFGMGWSVRLWELLHQGEKIEGAMDSSRFLGLASDILQLGYHASTAFIMTLFMDFKDKKWLRIVLLLIFGFAIIINNTRSAWIAAVVGLVIYLMTRPNSKTSKTMTVLSGLVIIFAVALVIMETGFIEDTRFSEEDTGTTARIPMLLTALNHCLNYPLGMGVYTPQPGLVVGADSAEYSVVLENTAHNLIGNCGAAYGIIGLVLMVVFYFFVFKNYKISETKFKGENNEYIIAAVCLIGLIINAFFHNSYMLNGELSSFLFFGVLLALPNVKKEEKALETEK